MRYSKERNLPQHIHEGFHNPLGGFYVQLIKLNAPLPISLDLLQSESISVITVNTALADTIRMNGHSSENQDQINCLE